MSRIYRATITSAFVPECGERYTVQCDSYESEDGWQPDLTFETFNPGEAETLRHAWNEGPGSVRTLMFIAARAHRGDAPEEGEPFEIDMTPPDLEIDKVLYSPARPMLPHVRHERRIVWNLIRFLEREGHEVVLVDDGEERTAVKDAKAALELISNVDESHIFFRSPIGNNHWVFLVGGNGEDIISDYSYTEGDPDGFSAAMDKFQDEVLDKLA